MRSPLDATRIGGRLIGRRKQDGALVVAPTAGAIDRLAPQEARDHLEVLFEPAHEVIEREPKGVVLGLVPPAPEADDQPPAGHFVERRAHLRHQPGIPERRAHHQGAELDPRHDGGEGRERRPGLDRPFVRLAVEPPDEVVEDPDRIEAEASARPANSAVAANVVAWLSVTSPNAMGTVTPMRIGGVYEGPPRMAPWPTE